MKSDNPGLGIWELQADAVISIVPVSGTVNPIIPVTGNVRIITATARVTWTVQPNPLELRMEIDGQTWNWEQANPVSARFYSAQIVPQSDPAAIGMADSTVFDPSFNRAFLIEGRSIQVDAEITGGTVQNLEARIKYAVKGLA